MPGQANLITEHPTLIAEITEQLGKTRPAAVVLDTLNKSLVRLRKQRRRYGRLCARRRSHPRRLQLRRDHRPPLRLRRHPPARTFVLAGRGGRSTGRHPNRGGHYRDSRNDARRAGRHSGCQRGGIIEVGQDQNGKVLTSLVVVPSDADAALAERQDWPRGLAVFHAALKTALATHGETFQPEAGVLPVRAVDQWHVRDRFYDTYAEAEENATKRQAKLRQAFNRALGDAQKRDMARVMRHAGKTMVWLPVRGET